MEALALARWQFAITTVYHFFFVPLTIGLGIVVALMETLYVVRGDEVYKRMTKFWGKLFVINFAMGVVTGIVMEFQFGMNWSEYSRFVGDIFGVPLAIEALLAFFLESTFLGIWIFGWDRLPKGLHAAAIWLVAIGSVFSAFWILVANSFMQEPVGYVLSNGRAEMADFGALVTSPHVWIQFSHVLFAGVSTAGFFTLGISAYHLWKKSQDQEVFQRSFRVAVVYALVGSVMVGLIGHTQGQYVHEVQPMKLAAAEALWQTEQPASFSIFTLGDLSGKKEIFSIRIPGVLSLLTCNNLTCQVKGINELQAEFVQKYGPGDYVPFLPFTYWSFRGMVGAGLLMILLAGIGLYLVLAEKTGHHPRFLKLLLWAIPLPYLANSSGWLLAETGRQPWVVYGLMKTADGVSQVVSPGTVLFSMFAFTVVYGVLMAVDVYLLAKYARKGVAGEGDSAPQGDLAGGAVLEGEV